MWSDATTFTCLAPLEADENEQNDNMKRDVDGRTFKRHFIIQLVQMALVFTACEQRAEMLKRCAISSIKSLLNARIYHLKQGVFIMVIN